MRSTLIVAGVLLISFLTGCLDFERKTSDEELEEALRSVTKTVVIDGCDYLYDKRNWHIVSHKGNCRRCANK